MSKTKYPINKEFLPLTLYTPTIKMEQKRIEYMRRKFHQS